MIQQEAPGAGLEILRSLISRLTYMQGWEFVLREGMNRGQGSKGDTLVIYVTVLDSTDPEREDVIQVGHYFPVPPAAYNERSWRRWVFEQVLLVERHEAMEFFQVDGKPVYPPAHGPGNDPYMVLEFGRVEDAETTALGVRLEGTQPQLRDLV
jgi:hypothetical protein